MTKGEFTLHLRHSRCKSGGPFLAECISGFPAFAENDGLTGVLGCWPAPSSPSLQSGGPCIGIQRKNSPSGMQSNTKAISSKQQAASSKQQAASSKQQAARGLSSNYGVLAKRSPP
jgi:hypothetical protein